MKRQLTTHLEKLDIKGTIEEFALRVANACDSHPGARLMFEYDERDRAELWVQGSRQETDTEEARREAAEAHAKHSAEARERAEYARLAAKFGGAS